MPASDGGDDFVWIGGPCEGLGVCVLLGDEAVDGGLEIDQRVECAALQAPLGEFGEEAFEPQECRNYLTNSGYEFV